MKTWLKIVSAVVALGAALVVVGPAEAHHENMAQRVQEAWSDASGRNTTVAISYMDRVTGEYRDNGSMAHARFGSASLVKLFIADDVLYRAWRGEFVLSDYDWQQLSVMLRSSDDPAASRFWSTKGGPAIVNRIKARYGLNEIQPPASAPWWGLTQVTSFDLTLYYQRMLSGAGGLPSFLIDYIIAQLRGYTANGTDGFYQRMGLPDGLPGEGVLGVKQGWMCCMNNVRTIHSTGIVGADARYIVIALGQEGTGPGWEHTKTSVTRVVQKLFPSGRIPRPAEHNPFGSFDVAGVDTEKMVLRSQGWVIDPDTTGPVTTHLYIGGGGFDLGPSAVNRPDIGQHFPAYGSAHGFDATYPLPGGQYNVCAYAINVSYGDANPLLGCKALNVPQKPFGAIDTVTPSAGKIRITGWVLESELAPNQSPAHVLIDGVAYDMGWAGVSRPDLANGYGRFGTNHGFDHTRSVAPGTHQVCVRGVDLGIAAGDTVIGCRTVTVP
ncbi:Lipoprotein LppW [Alloactinosynnema sp. L-07]|uniref:hypothetical protein n=1 Tax=Alloactinosynnema sp. L-07 TaxID=1653480 RepID=UPI00065EFD21|nr:hypothetical protein [Alloactinosynnema sp. L-07]CRK60859.1 Lipoprotein LppW [Alloactinosynnema sp. L-07]